MSDGWGRAKKSAKDADAIRKREGDAQRKKARAKPKAAKKADNDCLCGCGAKVSGRFKMGHDATYKSKILKVERGQMKKSELPEKMQKELTFTNGKEKGTFRCTNPQAEIKR